MEHNKGISDRWKVILNGFIRRPQPTSVNNRKYSIAPGSRTCFIMPAPVVESSCSDVMTQADARRRTNGLNTSGVRSFVINVYGDVYAGTENGIRKSTHEGRNRMGIDRQLYHHTQVHKPDSDKKNEAVWTAEKLVLTTARSYDCVTHLSDTLRGGAVVRAGSIAHHVCTIEDCSSRGQSVSKTDSYDKGLQEISASDYEIYRLKKISR